MWYLLSLESLVVNDIWVDTGCLSVVQYFAQLTLVDAFSVFVYKLSSEGKMCGLDSIENNNFFVFYFYYEEDKKQNNFDALVKVHI